MLGCAGGVATSGSSDGCAPGAVGAVVGELAAKYATETLGWDKEKALAFAGVMSAASGVIVAQDGNDAGAVNLANTMGDNAARYNYLADHQEAKKAKELAECKSEAECASIKRKWGKVSREQDLAYGVGIGIGIGIGALQAGVETLKALGSPIETVTALKDLLMQDDVLSTIGAAAKQDFLNRIATMESEYQAGGWDGARNAGIEVGRLILEVGSAVAGGAGAAKGVTTVVNKVATNVGKAAKVGGKGAAAELGKITGEFNMVENPGPLAKIPGNPASNFAGGKYTSVTLKEDVILYRGGDASGNPLGQWFTSEPPSSVAQVRIDTAVKPQWIDPQTGQLTGTSKINAVYQVRIPAGTTIYQGPVGNQGGIYVGGQSINQIFIPQPWKIPNVQVIGTPKPLK